MASHAMMVPLPDDGVEEWKRLTAEMTSRRRELEDMSRRHGLTRHSAWLQQTPDGHHVVIVLVEGARPESFPASVARSTHPFDRWFAEQIQRVHGVDLGGAMPMPTLHLDVRTEGAERGARAEAPA